MEEVVKYPINHLSEQSPVIAVLIFVIILLVGLCIGIFIWLRGDREFWRDSYMEVHKDIKELQNIVNKKN